MHSLVFQLSLSPSKESEQLSEEVVFDNINNTFGNE